MTLTPHAIGTPLGRLEGQAKVTGTAPYAYEHPLTHPAYAYAVQSRITRGRVTEIDTNLATELDGVIAVLTHLNARRLADQSNPELMVLQSDRIAFRGQYVAVVVADTPEVARHAADLLQVEYAAEPHDTVLSPDSDHLYTPEKVNPQFPTDTDEGDVDSAWEAADLRLDQTYTTPMEFNNPMEPHTTVAVWTADDKGGGSGDGSGQGTGSARLTLYDSTQGAHGVRSTMAPLLGLDPEQVRVVAPYVGGGFGSKGVAHAHCMLAALAAAAVPGRAVKFAVTRQQMFCITGHRTPTIQRVRLAAAEDGRLTAIEHDALEHTSKVKEFAEQTAVITRMMYASPNRRTTHRLAALDVPVPSWMRAPGETPGSFGLEVAMDELAVAGGLDPIELRIRNEPESDPETGLPWSGRHLVECLREGARRFGWETRAVSPRARLEDGWWVGLGVASSTYPAHAIPGSEATVEFGADQCYRVRIGAIDIGTGAWTALTQIAADALGRPVHEVQLEIGDTRFPMASVAGGSSGITSWGSTIVAAARAFRQQHGDSPRPGVTAQAGMPENQDRQRFAMHSFGAQFAEVRVHGDTGEIVVPRMLGVFSVGRIINPRTARSQFVGGMTMGLSMALHEHGVLDPQTGHVINHDFAQYHIASCADARDIEAVWLDEEDTHVNPMGSKGIGEIGIVGAAAAVANAAHHATGMRLRDLPITPDKFFS